MGCHPPFDFPCTSVGYFSRTSPDRFWKFWDRDCSAISEKFTINSLINRPHWMQRSIESEYANCDS